MSEHPCVCVFFKQWPVLDPQSCAHQLEGSAQTNISDLSVPSSSIGTVRGVAPCSKAPGKFGLRKGELLLIYSYCAHILPPDPQTKLGNSDSSLIPHFSAASTPSLSFPFVRALQCWQKVITFPSLPLSSCSGGNAGGWGKTIGREGQTTPGRGLSVKRKGQTCRVP